MAPLSLLSVSAVVVRTLGQWSAAAAVRYSCIAPTLKHFSTTVGGRPKRPLSAYMQYVKVQQPVVVRENPDIKVVDIVRKIAQQWRTLTPEQKRPFEEASSAAKEQYKLDMQKYQAQLTPAQTAAIAEERRQKMAKRKAIRKKRELNTLGKPKRPRTAFNIFMAEHFEEARGTTMQGKLKSLLEDWKGLNTSQQKVYVQLAEDDKIRYRNEMKAWEEHMIELGREDLIRRREKRQKKLAVTKGGKKKTRVKVLKAKAPAKKTAPKKTAPKKSTARATEKETESKPKK
ncbi:transcription factor A, mitochondrial [Pygocentrus nattereri]|uniref:Transcription factor A, mitochondrial n=1 Tax=Pygocentrus nattereri TaxID=42514 RepID=A0A3B4E4G7_PYGNA|nr:transcription factor A, mitochondrial [Pygocentrus nattereri]